MLIVLVDGWISLWVCLEVLQLSLFGVVQLNGMMIFVLIMCCVEIMLEFGLGQSMMIGGLIQNLLNNLIDKILGFGDVLIFGMLFCLNVWQCNEIELVIVIMLYLVKLVNNQSEIVLLIDGFKLLIDVVCVFLGELGIGVSGGKCLVLIVVLSVLVVLLIGVMVLVLLVLQLDCCQVVLLVEICDCLKLIVKLVKGVVFMFGFFN